MAVTASCMSQRLAKTGREEHRERSGQPAGPIMIAAATDINLTNTVNN